MTRASADELFGPVMFWTVLTGIFAWLPLARIIGRPEGYTWGILGLSGAGTEGPFWIFVVLTAYVLVMLFTGLRGPRPAFHPMLVLWHLLATGVVLAGVVQGGTDAAWQGQGLHFAIPMWMLVLPFGGFTAAALWWVALDRAGGPPPSVAPWGRRNTSLLVISLGLLAVALVLFRAGTNYDWVTALAILVTVAQWSVLVQSFAPASARAS